MTTEDFKEFVEEKGWEQESNRKGEGDTRRISGALSPTPPDTKGGRSCIR